MSGGLLMATERPGGLEPAIASMSDPAQLLDRADLLLCLSRAFLPPPAGWSVCDWAQALTGDLAELGASLGLDTVAVQGVLALACERWAQASARVEQGENSHDADPWLVHYARLFLTPPVPVTLNAGVYLEGALGGESVQMMLHCYAAAGIEPDGRFRDLPDHVAMQLEFLGRLYERAARGDVDGAAMAEEFSAAFVHGWAGALEQACRQAGQRWSAGAVYAELAALLRQAVGDPRLTGRA